MMKQVIAVRTDLGMGKGKIASQVAHASLLAFLNAQRSHPHWVKLWMENGMKKIVVKVGSEEALLSLKEKVKHLPHALVVDAGLTQVKPNTPTALGIGPCPSEVVDAFTSHLKLL